MFHYVKYIMLNVVSGGNDASLQHNQYAQVHFARRMKPKANAQKQGWDALDVWEP